MNYYDKILTASNYIKSKSKYQPKIGMILGSGLGSLADEIKNPEKYQYSEIPDFPVSTVHGHKGQLVVGDLEGKPVIAMQGRIHYYEGYTMKEITFPVRVMKELGVEIMIVTNACGGFNDNFYAGALMIITDHINLMNDNPLIGKNYDELGPRFPDMLNAYDNNLVKLALKVAEERGIEVFTGVHSAVTGPNFETKAELKMIGTLGADTVGMSTIPEVIVAKHGGMRSLGISAVTDMIFKNNDEPITHEEVLKVANEIKPRFISLVKGIVKEI